MKKKLIVFIFIFIIILLNIQVVFAFKEENKIIKIGGDFDYPPYEFVDTDGTYKGFNIDIMKAVAKNQGYDIKLVPLTWNESIKALRDGKIDAIQGVNKSKERQVSLNFSKPYTINEQVIFTLKDTTYISSLRDLKGKKVSMQKSDISEELVKGIEGIKVITKPTHKEAIELLFNEEVDAFIGNKTTGLYFIQKQNKLNMIKITGEPLGSVEYSLATTKENNNVINMFNLGFEEIKENGRYKAIYNKWFGEPVIYSKDMWKKATYAVIFILSIVGGIIGFTLFINKKLKSKVAERTRELEEVNMEVSTNEERYRRFIESCPDAIFSHGTDNKIMFVNNEGRRLLGARYKKEIIGKSMNEFIEDMSYADSVRLGYVTSKTIYNKTIRRVDGSKIDVEVRGSLMPYSEDQSILSIVTDISERKKLVEAIEYDKIKTEFFANISHELRTPLNVILASLQLLESKMASSTEDCLLENDVNKSISSIRHNGHRLLRLVNNLIDITKIDSGYISLNLTNGNIVDVIEETVTAVVEYALVKNIEVVFDTCTEELIIAYDEDKIERIMLNLLSNAVKFSEDGGKILVDIKPLGDKVRIRVIDNGVGIPSDKLSVVFERFRQVNKSLTRSFEGSGIGLSLTKALVEMLDGDITVESTYGEGSIFTVTLPIKVIDSKDEIESRSLITNKDMADIEFSDIT